MAKQLNYSFVMSRMEWFRDLKLIFNKLLPEEDILTPVDKSLIIKELNSKALKLDLKSPEEYNERSKLQAFSLSEIFEHVSRLDNSVNFDQLIDSLIYLSIDKKKKEKYMKAENTEQANKAKPADFLERISVENKSFSESKGPVKVNREIVKIKKKDSPIMDPVIDLNFPEYKLSDYPEIDSYECLKYLYLAGNNLSHTKFKFPQSLIALNLSCNLLSEIRFSQEMKNLVMLNVTENKVERIFSINQMKEVKELFMGNNCMTSVNLFCHLNQLHLLDCSSNYIESFEDIAGLVISKKLSILKLKGNPISSKEGYKNVIISLLPRIYNLDPGNIFELSTFKGLESPAFVPVKSSSDHVEQKSVKSINLIKSEKSITPSFKSSISNSPMVSKHKEINPGTSAVQNPSFGMKRSSSQIKIDKSKLTDTAKSGFSAESEETTVKRFDKTIETSVIDLAERRIKVFKEVGKTKHNISVISNDSIQSANKKVYGNPVAAMMIGPPAVGQGKRMAKTPVCYSLDLTKNRKK